MSAIIDASSAKKWRTASATNSRGAGNCPGWPLLTKTGLHLGDADFPRGHGGSTFRQRVRDKLHGVQLEAA